MNTVCAVIFVAFPMPVEGAIRVLQLMGVEKSAKKNKQIEFKLKIKFIIVEFNLNNYLTY